VPRCVAYMCATRPSESERSRFGQWST